MTYTTSADFSNGNLFNLEVADVNGQTCLKLADEVRAWPFIAVANSDRGTISRIAVDNSLPGFNEGDVVGEYRTFPVGMAGSPSRTTVDAYGNVWVGNRVEAGFVNGVQKGSVARIGLVIGGTRGDKNAAGDFVPNPTGDYLQGPFDYSTCEDRDGDGLIKTSRGYPHDNGLTDWISTHLPWPNADGADSAGGVSTAEDECITAYVRVAGTGVRFIAIDPFGDVWTGGQYTGGIDQNPWFEKIDGNTAHVVAGSMRNTDCGGYGGLVDKENILWSATGILRWDLGNNGDPPCLLIPSYGMSIDPQTNHIWASHGNNIREIDRDGTLLNTYPNGNTSSFTQGLVVDRFSRVWSAHGLLDTTTVGHNTTTGLHVGNVELEMSSPPALGVGPTGVAVDSNDKIWSANWQSDNAMRIDPNVGPIGKGGFNIGQVDLVVDLGSGSGPYNYSDMTGSVLLQAVAPQGSWTFIHDGGEAGSPWGQLSWTSIEGPGTSVEVRVRASDSPIPSGDWTVVASGEPFDGVLGQYLQVQITLHRAAKSFGEIMLCDLTICKESSCSSAIESLVCDPGESGTVNMTMEVFNTSGLDAEHILFTPMPPGSQVTITPNMMSQFVPNGGSANVAVTISGLPPGAPGQPFCFMTTLLDDSMQECCSFETCIEPDCECLQITAGSESIECDSSTGEFFHTFQFDNLTTDILFHSYFFAPPGVTIDPNYVAFNTPVMPGETSPPITLTISGPAATPGAEICFEMSIHDFFLNECCAREVCITLPSCEVETGACCILHSPDSISCHVNTAEACVPNGGGTATFYPGLTCGDPFVNEQCQLGLPDACSMTAVVSCCTNSPASPVTTVLTICNTFLLSQEFDWSISSLSDVGCVPLSPEAIEPSSGTTGSIAPGACVDIPITVQCTELANGGEPNPKSCLMASITLPDDPSSLVCTATGNVQMTGGVQMPGGLLISWWCWAANFAPGVIQVGAGEIVNVGIQVSNVGKESNVLIFDWSATSPFILLNGLFGGQTGNDYLFLEPGSSEVLEISVEMGENILPGKIHDVFLNAVIGDDYMQVASFGLRLVVPCLGDLDGDGSVGIPDLLILLATWGPCPPSGDCPADLDGNSSVGVGDLLILLGAWGSCP